VQSFLADSLEQSELNKTGKVLIVDDEPSALAVIHRSLKNKFDIQIADSPEKGLEIVKKSSFAVVISDLQMPGMDGIDFLIKVQEVSPDTIRMLLTGHAELETSIRAVNEVQIYRFLSKPCSAKVLEKAILAGLRQYHLIQTEREYYALKKWTEGLEGLIQFFLKWTEARDPYTAGHQNNVSQFSVSIAQSLGFSSRVVEQIRMAALVHDIGKINIPVEFLNKPSHLNESEWNIVKMHPEIGCDILRPIGFLFPLHEIILQHHERIDGSGYPKGLKESEICIEAQVIAVADVVDAMVHDRPYRPSKGLKEAICELTSNRGIKYASRIVDEAALLISKNLFHFAAITESSVVSG
jgi:response regulator RpfG family c-di-GMP phosphodiesterase